MRTPSPKAKSDSNLQAVIQATQKLWRRHHLSYDQTRYVAKQVRRALELERPQIAHASLNGSLVMKNVASSTPLTV